MKKEKGREEEAKGKETKKKRSKKKLKKKRKHDVTNKRLDSSSSDSSDEETGDARVIISADNSRLGNRVSAQPTTSNSKYGYRSQVTRIRTPSVVPALVLEVRP